MAARLGGGVMMPAWVGAAVEEERRAEHAVAAPGADASRSLRLAVRGGGAKGAAVVLLAGWVLLWTVFVAGVVDASVGLVAAEERPAAAEAGPAAPAPPELARAPVSAGGAGAPGLAR